jgi:hypothetical protein
VVEISRARRRRRDADADADADADDTCSGVPSGALSFVSREEMRRLRRRQSRQPTFQRIEREATQLGTVRAGQITLQTDIMFAYIPRNYIEDV